MEDFVFHFTGKLNQSYIMKDSNGAAVYEAIWEKFVLIGPTPYRFCNRMTGYEEEKMIGHTVTYSTGTNHIMTNISSSFKIDKVDVWDILKRNGYEFKLHLVSLVPNYEVFRNGVSIGTIIAAGSGAMNPKYANSALGNIPARGIFRVTCERDEVPAFFLICFALSRTDMSMNEIF